MTNNTQAEVIKCLKQELTDSMIPALTRIDMEMMKLHHKFETVLTKIDKHESLIEHLITLSTEHDHRLEQFITEAREVNAKTLEHFTQLKKEMPFIVPPYPPRPPPPRLPPPGGFRFPPPYDHFSYRSPAEFAIMPGHPLSYYQQPQGHPSRKDHADKKKAGGKNRENGGNGEPSMRSRQFMRTVLPSSAGHRVASASAPQALNNGGASSSQQWTRRGTGVFTSDEESEDTGRSADEDHRNDAGALVDAASLDGVPSPLERQRQNNHELSHVTAMMTVSVTKKQLVIKTVDDNANDGVNDGSVRTAIEDDQLLWDDNSWGLHGRAVVGDSPTVYTRTAVSLSPIRLSPDAVVPGSSVPSTAENVEADRKPAGGGNGNHRAKRTAGRRKAGREPKNV